ncbi:amino acid ABC transporter permease [Phycicoccus jejuensis]|uniref:amino acid ABC transporter permease n=1 Tax=Phycicoccus jejuensis TaxID=367299 RepID=UPI00384B1DAF
MSSDSVLFDAPGPRARLRHSVLTVIGVLLVVAAGWIVYRKMSEAGQLDPALWTPFVTDPAVWTEYLLPGFWETLKAAAASVVLAGVYGLVFGMGRLSHVRAVRWVSGVVVEFFRSVPVLLMMVFLFFGYFATATWLPNQYAPMAAVVVGLTLYNGSVIAELVRSGVHSLPAGQAEAGLSIGLSPSQTLRSIQLPQALRAMLPALVGQLVVVLKDTALGTVVLYPELLTAAKTLGSAYANTLQAYIVAAAVFVLVNYALTVLAGRVERWLGRRGRSAGTPRSAAVPSDTVPTAEATSSSAR